MAKHYYIYGSETHPKSVIAALEAKGGKNTYEHKCDVSEDIYFIDVNGEIDSADDADLRTLLVEFGERLYPEPAYLFAVGDKVILNGNDSVIATVTEQVNNQGKAYYKVQATIEYLRPESDLQLYAEIRTLFQPFQKVLCRNNDDEKWMPRFFSHYDRLDDYPYFTMGACYRQCIPYEGNEHLYCTKNPM